MHGTLKACGKDPKYPETGKFNITFEHGGNSDGPFRMMKLCVQFPPWTQLKPRHDRTLAKRSCLCVRLQLGGGFTNA